MKTGPASLWKSSIASVKNAAMIFLIEYRISGEKLIEGGMQIDDVIEFVKMIEESMDIIHVSAGIHDSLYTIKRMFSVISFTKPGCNVHLVEAMKKHVKIPVITVGGINTPEHAEQILAEGKADIIGILRQTPKDYGGNTNWFLQRNEHSLRVFP